MQHFQIERTNFPREKGCYMQTIFMNSLLRCEMTAKVGQIERYSWVIDQNLLLFTRPQV